MAIFIYSPASRYITPLPKSYANRSVNEIGDIEEITRSGVTGGIQAQVNRTNTPYSPIENLYDNSVPSESIAQLSHQQLVTILETKTLYNALELMSEHAIHHLIVINDDNRLVGVLDNELLIKQLLASNDIKRIQLGQLPYQPSLVLAGNLYVPEVAKTLLSGNYSYALILFNKEITGIVTASDILKALAKLSPTDRFA